MDSIETKDEWTNFLVTNCKIPLKEATISANVLITKNLSLIDVVDLIFTVEVRDENVFGLSMGHLLKIKRWIQNNCVNVNTNPTLPASGPTVHYNGPKVDRPKIDMNVTLIEWDQFCFDWSMFKDHYKISPADTVSHLLFCCEKTVRQRLRIDIPNFNESSYTEEQLLEIISNIVLTKTSRIMHIKNFYDTSQKKIRIVLNF